MTFYKLVFYVSKTVIVLALKTNGLITEVGEKIAKLLGVPFSKCLERSNVALD